MRQILIGTFLIVTILSLHLQNHHQQSKQYLSALKSQQQSITESIQSLQQDINQTKQNANQQSSITQKIKLLEQGIIRQQKIIQQMSFQTVTPLDQVNVVCPNLNQTNKDQLTNLANQLEQSTTNLQQSVSALNSAQKTQQFETSSAALDDNAQKIKQTLSSNTQFISPQQFKPVWLPNLAAQDWSRGNMTQQQINDHYEKIADEADVVKYCDISTPFYDGQQCIACPQNRYFDLSTNKCIQCEYFNQEDKVCEKVRQQPNSVNFQYAKNRLILPTGQTPTQLQQKISQQAVSCPSDKPFYSNGECINCISPQSLFNYTSSKCTSCPQNTIYNPQKAKCQQQAKKVTNLISSSDNIIIPDDKTLDQLLQQQKQSQKTQNIQACPTSQPFFDGQKCINCGQKYFDISTSNCMNCPDSTTYSKITHRCLQIKYYSNVANSNWTSTNSQQVKKKLQQAGEDSSYKQCPIQQPFYNGEKCIKCEQNEYFSFDAQQCSKCSASSLFSPNLHQCVTPTYSQQTNPIEAPNLIYGGISKNQWSTKYYKKLQQNLNIADCPQQRPYYDGTVCVKCPDTHPYFNLRYKMCQSCEQESQYDEKVRECLSTQGAILDQTPNLQKMAAGIFS